MRALKYDFVTAEGLTAVRSAKICPDDLTVHKDEGPGPVRARAMGMFRRVLVYEEYSVMKKIACLFPGIGYTCDKPLLYYSWKMLKGLGWEIVPVEYSGFPSGVKGNAEKMQQCAHMALEQAEEILQEIDWNEYDEILFIGKSVGTVVCAAYAKRHRLRCRQVLFTPVEAAFGFAGRDSIVFHGTADPWADTKAVEIWCKELNLPLYETEGANHSLETGDVDADIKEIRSVMKTVRKYIQHSTAGTGGPDE